MFPSRILSKLLLLLLALSSEERVSTSDPFRSGQSQGDLVGSVSDQAELSLLEGSENLFDAEVAAHRELLRGDHS